MLKLLEMPQIQFHSESLSHVNHSVWYKIIDRGDLIRSKSMIDQVPMNLQSDLTKHIFNI